MTLGVSKNIEPLMWLLALSLIAVVSQEIQDSA